MARVRQTWTGLSPDHAFNIAVPDKPQNDAQLRQAQFDSRLNHSGHGIFIQQISSIAARTVPLNRQILGICNMLCMINLRSCLFVGSSSQRDEAITYLGTNINTYMKEFDAIQRREDDKLRSSKQAACKLQSFLRILEIVRYFFSEVNAGKRYIAQERQHGRHGLEVKPVSSCPETRRAWKY
ncbi:hypothetical protein AA313_de0200849 [Arthrobotrys entomopaga]|nr:hypothetical protein AA313_de0200849 [Arthrobotrys entomopaga]